MIQNPGGVLCHIFMVGLLSQVMDNESGNVVNENAVKNSAIPAGEKTQSMLSQVVKSNIRNEDHREVDVTMDKENNPEQGPTCQVVEVNFGNKDHRDVDVTMDNENNPEQVPTCQVVEVNIGNEDHRDVEVNMDNENNSEQVPISQVVDVVDVIDVNKVHWMWM
jgi:hypothetical protein